MPVGAPASRQHGQEGAALLEFAIVLPLLLILLFGVIEAGWAFSQQLEVRHGAREGARLLAVNEGTDAEIVAEVCDRMHFSGENSETEILLTLEPGGDGTIGDTAKVSINAPYNTLTGFFDGVFGDARFDSEVEIRLEQKRDPAEAGIFEDVVIKCSPAPAL